MYTGRERLWNALALCGLGAEAFGGDGNFDGNNFFCYHLFLPRRSSSCVFRVSDCHQNYSLLIKEKRQPTAVGVLHCGAVFPAAASCRCGLLAVPAAFGQIKDVSWPNLTISSKSAREISPRRTRRKRSSVRSRPAIMQRRPMPRRTRPSLYWPGIPERRKAIRPRLDSGCGRVMIFLSYNG